MRIQRLVGLSAGLLVVFAVGCDRLPTGQRGGPDAPGPRLSMHATCQPTGTGLTARVVNEDVIDETIDVGDCDVGAFFSEKGEVRDATFLQDDDAGVPTVQYAVLVRGAKVNVTDSEVDVAEDFAHQFIGIGYRDGASGRIEGNAVTGFHRVGILLDGTGTSARVRGNEIVGIGPKTAGWAENGIQVSRGATGTVGENEVRDHWWDLNNFLSSGILVFGSDNVDVQRNVLGGNDAALAVVGDRNNFHHNEVDVTDEDGAASGIFHAGAVLYGGTNNGFNQNRFASASPEGSVSVGLFVTAAASNTKLIRNRFDGFGTPIVDEGEATKLPRPFVPDGG